MLLMLSFSLSLFACALSYLLMLVYSLIFFYPSLSVCCLQNKNEVVFFYTKQLLFSSLASDFLASLWIWLIIPGILSRRQRLLTKAQGYGWWRRGGASLENRNDQPNAADYLCPVSAGLRWNDALGGPGTELSRVKGQV